MGNQNTGEMTAEELAANASAETVGGYLKVVDPRADETIRVGDKKYRVSDVERALGGLDPVE